jgi:hypothetical protein
MITPETILHPALLIAQPTRFYLHTIRVSWAAAVLAVCTVCFAGMYHFFTDDAGKLWSIWVYTVNSHHSPPDFHHLPPDLTTRSVTYSRTLAREVHPVPGLAASGLKSAMRRFVAVFLAIARKSHLMKDVLDARPYSPVQFGDTFGRIPGRVPPANMMDGRLWPTHPFCTYFA